MNPLARVALYRMKPVNRSAASGLAGSGTRTKKKKASPKWKTKKKVSHRRKIKNRRTTPEGKGREFVLPIMTDCPVCHCRVSAKRLSKHLKKVHPTTPQGPPHHNSTSSGPSRRETQRRGDINPPHSLTPAQPDSAPITPIESGEWVEKTCEFCTGHYIGSRSYSGVSCCLRCVPRLRTQPKATLHPHDPPTMTAHIKVVTPVELAIETYNLTLGQLPPSLSGTTGKVSSDPQSIPFKKSGGSIIRIRLLPIDRSTPSTFWDTRWCFYEIGVGTYEGDHNCLGRVQFVMYPDNLKCGSGRHRGAVTQILSKLSAPAGGSYFFDPLGGPKQAALLSGFQYRTPPQTSFSPEVAARDLAWLIVETLPRFAVL